MRSSSLGILTATTVMVLLFLIAIVPATADEPAGTDVSWTRPVTGYSPDRTNLSFLSGPQRETVSSYPLMHFTPARFNEMQQQHRLAPKYSAPFSSNILDGTPPTTGSKSLLPYISYVPAERDQGNCGVMGSAFRYARAVLPLFGSELVYCHMGETTAEGQYSVEEFVALKKLLLG